MHKNTHTYIYTERERERERENAFTRQESQHLTVALFKPEQGRMSQFVKNGNPRCIFYSGVFLFYAYEV